MRMNLYASFRVLAGTKALNIDLPDGVTVRQAVEAAADQCPQLRSHWFDDTGAIHAHVHIFINGVDMLTTDSGADTLLKPADVLDIFPPIGGGAC